MPAEDPGGGEVVTIPPEPAGPDRQTRVVGGNGTDTLSYSLPAGLYQYVESVNATVDNAAGGDATPELAIATSAGVVVARQTQADVIPGGDTGDATFALRLGDKPNVKRLREHVGYAELYMRAFQAEEAFQVAFVPVREAVRVVGGAYMPLSLTWSMLANSNLRLRVVNFGPRTYSVQLNSAFLQRLDVSAHENLSGPDLVLTAGADGDLEWQHVGGAALLTFANPALPKIVTAGLYALTATVLWH